jgi:hypothetical protein
MTEELKRIWKRLRPNIDSTPAFHWMQRGKPRTTSVKIDVVAAQKGTEGLH